MIEKYIQLNIFKMLEEKQNLRWGFKVDQHELFFIFRLFLRFNINKKRVKYILHM